MRVITKSTSQTCCFIGHRTINETEELKADLTAAIEKLIQEEGVDTFLFGSKSRFNSLCLELVTELKEKHPQIKRIYVRAEYPVIDADYKAYLLQSYEDTYYPDQVIGAGKASYVERNYEMIDRSDYCIFYYRKGEDPATRKSGTRIAFEYAQRKRRRVICFPGERECSG